MDSLTRQQAIMLHNILCNGNDGSITQLGMAMLSNNLPPWIDTGEVTGEEPDKSKQAAAFYRTMADALEAEGEETDG